MSAPKALKPIVSDFGSQFDVYSVKTDDGWAFKGNGKKPGKYERAVDIGRDRELAFTTDELQKLYGDTHGLRVRCRADGKPWPQNISIVESPLSLVTLTMTFVKAAGLHGAALADKNNPVETAFHKVTAPQGLRPLDLGLITATTALENGDWLVANMQQVDSKEAIDLLNDKAPVIVTVPNTRNFLSSAHALMLAQEALQPGFLARNPLVTFAALYEGTGRVLANDEMPAQVQETPVELKILAEMTCQQAKKRGNKATPG